MPYTISELVVLFFTYSVVGWLWETFYCSIKDHHYAYRGFLFGPYWPVYGTNCQTKCNGFSKNTSYGVS